MNAAVADLDRFLREADPDTARAVERTVLGLLSMHSKSGETRLAPGPSYRLPERRLGAHAGLDLTRLAHVDDD